MPADRPRAGASAPRAVPVNRSPLSFAQQRLWFLSQIEGASEAYHIFSAWRLLGRLNSGALRKALDRIIVRHEALRTTFAVVDAAPVQQVAPAPGCRFALVEEDWRTRTDSAEALERLMRQESVRPFDLRTGPMIRGYLVRLTDMEHALLVTMHHIVSDGWSTGVLINEFCALYGAFCEGRPDPLPPLALQYPGYSLWQRRFLEGPRMQQHVEYWRKALAGAPTILELPADFPRPPRQQFAGSFAELRIDEALTVRLKEMSRKHGVTLYMTLLAAWALLSGRLSGQSDVIIGTPVANRERTELQPMIGLFVNTLALRLNVEGSQTVAQLLKQVRVDTFAAFQHQDIPFEQVVDVVQPKRTLAHSPLFQVMFQWQALPGGALTLPELRVEPMRSAEAMPASKFDMTLSLGEINGGIAGGIEYATALFAPETVAMYGRYLRALLEAMAADDTRSLGHLPLLSAMERQRLVAQWNQSTAAAPTQRYVHELFEDQASATPDALAVVSAGRNLSYRELNERASRLASYLRTHGVGPDDRVAICVERSPEMLISILGVLKAGGSYVPVDPGYPADRMAYMLEECAPRLILTQECVKQKLPPALPAVAIDLEWSEIESCLPFEGDRVTTGLMPENLAYVIFTSGSTGRPKGTSVEHRGLSNLLQWYTGEMAGIDLNRVLIVSSFSFDLTQKNLLVPLLTGGQVHLAAEPFDPAAIARQIEAEGITAMNLTPSALYAILESCDARRLSSLRKVVLGGEAITAVRLAEFARACPQVQIINNYGPTESTDVASVCTLPGADELARGPQIPIGRALPNMRLYILDAHGEPVPTGVSGELYLGGIGVARGYLHRPELTAQRFVADAFSDIPGARAYRTGDLARYRRDGQIEFQGRNDFQVKLRGYRIELGEIEAGLLAFEGIRQAVVVAREDSTGDKRLVAYYTATPGGEAVTAEQLRTHLSSLLPAYMVPAAYVRLEQLPLTPSGKLDRRSLPSPDASAYAAPEYEAPQGPMETTMAAIWGELLEVDRIGRHDDFFERGGHSLLMLKLVMRLQQAFGLDVKITDVFEHPVLADLARALQNARGQRAILPPITRADRRQRLPLTFAQQRLWFLAQMEGGSDAYNLSFGMRLEGQLNYAALRRALDRIIARHESLRTTFTFEDGTPAQRIAPIEESRFHLVEHDLSRDPGWKMRVLQLEQEEARQSFDFVRGPLIRGLLIRFSDRTHVLRISLHHVICDGWSLRVVRREIAALYDAFSNDQPDPLPELPIQHADFAVWQRQWSGGDVLGRQGEYWKARLAGAPALLELPTDHPRPPRQDYAGSVAKVVLDEKLSGAIRVLARRHDA
ncbi:MAG TPA: amino acid adenylation domain-containing protein, partial [Steroidobacteraceae bacterium]|nr:amino acid adenylation domain-containing protein [Steroidobacteraceae bacterium]